jgi:hypothetical protein
MSVHYQQPVQPTKGSFGWAVLGFFVPLVGLILWLVWQKDRPGDSRRARNGFIAGVIAYVLITIIYVVVIAAILSSV